MTTSDAGVISVVDKVLPKKNRQREFMYSKDTHLIPSNLALAVWSLMMFVNEQSPSCCFIARLPKRTFAVHGVKTFIN